LDNKITQICILSLDKPIHGAKIQTNKLFDRPLSIISGSATRIGTLGVGDRGSPADDGSDG
jgi:hypothetical protein